MRKNVARIALGILFLVAVFSFTLTYFLLRNEEEVHVPVYVTADAVLPELSATSWLIFDTELGEVLYAVNEHTPLPIASITKLATAARFIETNDMNATTSIVWSDVATEGRAGKLQYGDVYTNRELLFPLLLESSNDAASTLERIDTTLIERMNAYSEELALGTTSFADGSGLSDRNVSTAHELMILARHILQTGPRVIDMTRVQEFYSEENGWFNNNPFIEDPAYVGGKHGFTNEANRTVIAFFDEDIHGGTRTLGYVLLGSDDLKEDMRALRDHVARHTTYQ